MSRIFRKPISIFLALIMILGTNLVPNAIAAPGDNFLESSHTVSCGSATITLRNVSPWIYPMSVEIDGVHSYGPVVDNRTDGKLNGPQKDRSVTRTITFPEDSGVHTVRYRVQAGSEDELYKNLPVGEWTEFTVETNCKASITYSATTGGEVDPKSEEVGWMADASGSIATAAEGYLFKNWTNSAGDVVSTSINFIPQKLNGKNVEDTYTANFVPSYELVYSSNPPTGTPNLISEEHAEADETTVSEVLWWPEGLRFTGWKVFTGNDPDFVFLANHQPGDLFEMPAKNVTFMAQWGPALNHVDHFQYIGGYPDNTIRPDALITREEVATIYYRLLMDASRDLYQTSEHHFPDVEANRWSAQSIATLANAGILGGYEDGTFRPGEYITRAEFITIASRFYSVTASGSDSFPDIAGHWANPLINSAAKKGWIAGYPDGTFKPDQRITRAETVSLINRVLNRRIFKENLLEDVKQFSDLLDTEWYYTDMQEAINSHTYLPRVNPETEFEIWIEIIHPALP